MRAFLRQLVLEARGLQARATILLMAIVTIALGLTGMLFLRVTAQMISRGAEDEARTLAKALSSACVDPIRRGDREALGRIVDSLMTQNNLVYILFTDIGGEVLACKQATPGLVGRWMLAGGTHALVHPIDRPTLINDESGPRIDVVYPVTADIEWEASRVSTAVGFIRLGLSLTREDQALLATTRQVMAIAIGVVLLIVPLGFEVVRRIVSPLNELSAAAREVAGGRFSTRVRIARDDEIGRLGESFNRMASDLERSHQTLMKLNSELETRVARRTEELREANRLLRIEIAEREELLRAVSHDLHAPLRNVTGQTMLLRRRVTSELAEPVRHCLDRIEHNVQYASDMIDELLELSRLRTTREPLAEVDLEAEVRGVVRQLESELERKGVRVIVDRPLPTLTVERRRIRHLMQNLLDNAIKYTPAASGDRPGASDVHVTYVEAADEFEFRIADRGVGVREEDRESIFNLFSRARTRFVSQTPGKGVGLSYSKSIVQLYDGRIWVEDNPGGGSVFCFTLSKSAMRAAAGRGPDSVPPYATVEEPAHVG